LLAIGVLYALPYIASAGYMHGKGVHVRSVDDGSSVGGVSGLHDGDVVYAINDCKVCQLFVGRPSMHVSGVQCSIMD
jgi:hypothetical protein